MSNGAFSEVIALQPIGNQLFEASPRDDSSETTYGGQFLAQALTAGYHTVDADRRVHSLHAYFLRPGQPQASAEYEVTTVRDGRSFSHRLITARQSGKEIFCMTASFCIELMSYDFQGKQMATVPPPDCVDYTYEQFCKDQIPDPDYIRDVQSRPMDIRYINPPRDRAKVSTVDDQLMWMTILGTLKDERSAHDAGLAYLSDSTLIDHILLPHGKRWQDPDFEGTSLDHAMWFHSRCDATKWLLFDQTVEWTGDGRGLATGRFFNDQGRLVATCAQEGLMRFD